MPESAVSPSLDAELIERIGRIIAREWLRHAPHEAAQPSGVDPAKLSDPNAPSGKLVKMEVKPVD